MSDTETVFDGLDPVAQTGGAAADRTMLGGVEMGSDGSVSWKLTDRAGDVVAVTGADGGVVAMAGYSDFGVTKTTGDWDVLTAHSGELSDPTVGMDLYYRRAYDPLTANWGQADPYRGLLAAPQSLNRYGFVKGNPQTLRDSYGYRFDEDGWGHHTIIVQPASRCDGHESDSVCKKSGKSTYWGKIYDQTGSESAATKADRAYHNSPNWAGAAIGSGSSSNDRTARNTAATLARTIELVEAQRWEDAASYARFVNSEEGRQRTAEPRNTLGFLRLAAGPNASLNTNHLLAMQRWFGGDQGATVWDDLPAGLQSMLDRPANVIVAVSSAPKSTCAHPLQRQYCETTSSPDMAGVPRAPGEPGAGTISGNAPIIQQGAGAGVPVAPSGGWSLSPSDRAALKEFLGNVAKVGLIVATGASGCAAGAELGTVVGTAVEPGGGSVVGGAVGCPIGAAVEIFTIIDESNPKWAG